jgi:uncharacterized protein (DUF302 family)
MKYYLAKILAAPFDEVVSRTRAGLQKEGFGVLTEVDVRETLKKKLDVDFRRYLILGACNPALAYEALQLEDKVGTMLPCNVIVQEKGDGDIEVAAIDPVASMQAIDNKDLIQRAQLVRAKLKRVIEGL